MALTFPNECRSFDDARQGVRFVGYDGMFEVPFVIEAAALTGDAPAGSQSSCLAAFDSIRTSIHDAAGRIYKGRRPTVYVITASDLC